MLPVVMVNSDAETAKEWVIILQNNFKNTMLTNFQAVKADWG